MKQNEIHTADIWNQEKTTSLGKFIAGQSARQTKERKLKNELLAIQYQIEDYIDSDKTVQKMCVLDFVKMYLSTLNFTQRQLAALFEMKDSNLHKYLTGERKLNTDIVLKLSSFTHLSPEHWLRIEVKNELIDINKEKKNESLYRKYDYRNLLAAGKFKKSRRRIAAV